MIRVVRWTGAEPPTEQEAEARLHQEGYDSFRWHDVPGADYPRHRHDHDECLWILRGRITFVVDTPASTGGATREAGSAGGATEEHSLEAGDRLYLPARTAHTARVPASGSVTYLVGQKR
jgi:mannose-6-phosphate isomerase-like protein (cupin superfamily)